MLDADANEYWDEVRRLSELLKRWDMLRDEASRVEVIATLEDLGLILPKE